MIQHNINVLPHEILTKATQAQINAAKDIYGEIIGMFRSISPKTPSISARKLRAYVKYMIKYELPDRYYMYDCCLSAVIAGKGKVDETALFEAFARALYPDADKYVVYIISDPAQETQDQRCDRWAHGIYRGGERQMLAGLWARELEEMRKEESARIAAEEKAVEQYKRRISGADASEAADGPEKSQAQIQAEAGQAVYEMDR